MRNFLLLAVLFCLSVPVRAEAALVVVELFTSQGCASCPPAEKFLAELTERPGVIALEYHVDYWDRLITFSGRWKDPFSSPEWTRRQQAYAALISGAGRTYTPQMVVNGKKEAKGFDRESVLALIEKAAVGDAGFEMRQRKNEDGTYTVLLSGGLTGKSLEVVLASFISQVETEVKAGENKGAKLLSRNVVQSLLSLGVWHGGKQEFRYPASSKGPGRGCAILLQDKVDKAITAASFCPE